jgi:deoxyribonuclease V
MQVKKLHNWNLSYSQAITLQKQLSEKVQLIELKNQPKIIAGIDCALSKDGQRIVATAVVLSTRTTQKDLWGPVESSGFEIIETTNAIQKLAFSYIPGLLSFREAPVCIAAVEKLKKEPDLFIIDGQGIAHPRRLGLAAHLGLFFDRPTIGCAKSRLTGTFREPQCKKGAYSLLWDKEEIIGAVVRTREKVKPVFISVGNHCTLEDAIKTTLACTTKYRLPEPTRLAHQFVSKIRLKA